ncbi:MAG TPA: hypothetical protein VGM37_07560 [Armatimonadota bacterium]|jgi:hypothetical protein
MNWTRLATAALFVAAVPALAQNVPVRILAPAPEQTVRGSVPISINAAAVPNTGYMTVEVNDQFMAALAKEPGAKKITFNWDTKANYADTGAPPRDGQYTVRVKTYTSDFRFVRSNELNVYLRNRINVAADKAIRLRYKFKPDDQISFVEKVSARAAGVDLYSAQVPVTLEINDVTGDVAEGTEKIAKTAVESAQGSAQQPMALAGRRYLVYVHANGRVTPGPKMKKANVSPALSMVTLPNSPIRIGDTWNNDITITPYYQGVTSASVAGTHKLVGLEYYGGRPAAKIESTYDGDATANVSGQDIKVHFKGTRTTFFDYMRGRLLRAEDTVSTDFGVPGSSAPTGNPYAGGGSTPGSGSSASLTIITAAR